MDALLAGACMLAITTHHDSDLQMHPRTRNLLLLLLLIKRRHQELQSGCW